MADDNHHEELRQRIVRAADRLIRARLLSRNNHGNISIRIPETDQILLTGGILENIDPARLARITFDGEVLEGVVEPQAQEIVDMHTVVYRHRPEIGGVVHTHSPFATAYAVASKPMPCYSNALARLDIAEPIPVAPYGPRGSELAVKHIAETLDANPGCKALLLENHGILTFEPTLEQAVQVVFAMEENAEGSLLASLVGEAKPIPLEMIRASHDRRDAFERQGTIAR